MGSFSNEHCLLNSVSALAVSGQSFTPKLSNSSIASMRDFRQSEGGDLKLLNSVISSLLSVLNALYII